MDQEFVDAVRTDNRTALSRLGSSKALYADTAGNLADEAVLQAAADRAHHAAETLTAWAEAADGDVEALFAETAAAEREHVETVADERGDYSPGDPPAVQTYLRTVDGTDARLGAFVGWALAASENAKQVVGYFVGQASPRTASTFRDVSGDYEQYLETASETVTRVEHPDEARRAADAAVEADYNEYFDTLEEMGVNPKPVC
jgi:hypothetical protein